ncbi:MAG TPA: glycosyltransferase family 2 protein [Acidimicrobiales bacterium]|nr:glycosyltransferase family 2 protein [Acidimicrobiales bacterium]
MAVNDPARPAGPSGAVVVNYNAGSALAECVASLRSAGVAPVVVVDNGSEDGSLATIDTGDSVVRIVPAGKNLGYGRAVNRGATHLATPFVLVVNPDVVVEPDAVDALARRLEAEPDVAVVGPLIRNPGGSTYPSARSFPSFTVGAGHALVGMFWPDNRWTRRYRDGPSPDAGGRRGTREVDWVSGSCALVRREAFVAVGGFDEGYFMYVEDLDLCWRLRRAGWRVLYEPAAAVTHRRGLSTAAHPYRMLVAHHRSTLRFARKSLVGARTVLLILVVPGLGARLAVACCLQMISELGGRRPPRLD